MAAVSCGGGGGEDEEDEPGVTPSVAVSSVSLSPTTMTIAIGESSQLTATVKPDNATNKTVGYASSNTSVATVSTSGLVTGVAEGTATITATSGGKTATCSVTVVKQAQSITLSATKLEDFYLGDSIKLTATVVPEYSMPWSVTWESNDTTVATVSSDGLVKAVGIGSTTVTASAGGKTATCQVEVKGVLSISLSATKLEDFYLGDSIKLTATVEPGPSTRWSVTWESHNTSVVTVSSDGLVKAVGIGTATVTVEAGGKTAFCQVEVKGAESITLSSTSTTLSLGRNFQLQAEVKPERSTPWVVTWTSSDTNVATVTDNGLVKPVALGTATITAEAGGKSATCRIEVKNEPLVDVTGDKATIDLNGADATQVATSIRTAVNNGAKSFTFSGDYSSLDLGYDVFHGLDVKSIDFTGITGWPTDSEGYKEFPEKAFFEHANIEEIILPAEVTSIGRYAFWKCTSLKRVVAPGIRMLREFAFQWATSLAEVDMPDVEHIERCVFYATSLTECKFQKLKIVESMAFWECPNLTVVDLPVCTQIGTEYSFGNESRKTQASVFYGCKKLKTVNIPSAELLCFGAFEYCTGLVSVNMPNVVKISGVAFYGCSSLVEADMPKANTLGQHVFFYCGKLQTIKLTTPDDIEVDQTSTFGAANTVTEHVDLTLHSNKRSELTTNEYSKRTSWRTYNFRSYTFVD